MPRILRDEINALPDALTNDAFVLTFGSIPGETENRRLALQCQTFQLPEETNNPIEEMLAGFQKRQSGTRTNQGTISATFLETHDMAVLTRLRTWSQNARGTQSGSSVGYSQDYTVNGLLEVYDTAGNLSTSCTIYNMFPSNIDAIELNSSANAEAIKVSVTFTYNYAIYAEGTTL